MMRVSFGRSRASWTLRRCKKAHSICWACTISRLFAPQFAKLKARLRPSDELEVRQIDGPSGPEVRFTVRARSFLHNQVRSFVGTLESVGSGAWTPDDVKTALEAQDRQACGPVSPPHGLYLAHVTYPEDVFKSAPV